MVVSTTTVWLLKQLQPVADSNKQLYNRYPLQSAIDRLKVCVELKGDVSVAHANNRIIFHDTGCVDSGVATTNHQWDLETDKKFISKMVGVKMHLGHQTRDWHPNMGSYIRAKREDVHIINLVHTLFCLQKAAQLLTLSASRGKQVLFVGTKRQAATWVEKAAESCNSFFVTQKWLGGTLTNWKKISRSLDRLQYLESLERNGEVAALGKKQTAANRREKDRLLKHLGGLKKMPNLPDVVVLVGQPEELNAVHECRKLGIKTITVVDTNCDPLLADLSIPSNDDSTKAVALVLTRLVVAIQRGQRRSGLSIMSNAASPLAPPPAEGSPTAEISPPAEISPRAEGSPPSEGSPPAEQ